MTFSIIIINYRTPELTAACLRSILRINSSAESGQREIIVIDNGSADGSAEILEKEFAGKIKLIKNEQNLGFARANNQGAASANGNYLLFLNSDTLLATDIFPPIEKIFAEAPDVDIISPRLLRPDGKTQEGAYGCFPTLAQLVFKKRFGKKPAEEINQPFPVDWVSGCALFIRRDRFEKIGGWDGKFFLYFEDVDLCCRIAQVGGKTIIAPQITLTHLGGQSLQKNTERRRYYYQAQNHYFRKHYGRIATLALRIIRWPYKLWMLRK